MAIKNNKPVIILSPLDWGLGHTTRCIPIIETLIELQCTVLLACEPNSASEKILKTRFPQLIFLPTKGYNIAYAKQTQWFALKIVWQVPKILAAIKNEHKMLKHWVSQYQPDFIISDNRYGFYHKKVTSIFITHQLQIAAPNRLIEHIIQKINYRFIHHFRECWIPDFAGKNNIAGRLSHPHLRPATPLEYIGPLCRIPKKKAEKKYAFLILLSGPEPQRTVLEKAFLTIKNLFSSSTILIRGLPKAIDKIPSTDNFEIKNYCDADELALLIAQAEYVISRPGYTTVMELLYLQKKAIFIPTPGQTEQEYLAQKMQEQGWAYSFEQSSKDYYSEITKAATFHYQLPQIEDSALNIFLSENIADLNLSD